MKNLLLIALLFALLPLRAQPALAPAADLEVALKKARVNGKYSMLLAQINVPQDEAQYGSFNDHGFNQMTEWQGIKNLPVGYWVYVAPFWYIWRDQAQTKRRWGPEQLTGEPDTPEPGDQFTAWASKSQDESDEWLILEYANVVAATGVKIYETHCAGAVSKISIFTLDGKEEIVWAGVAAPRNDNVIVVNEKQLPRPLKTNRVKIYLDSKKVPGWNEIDAVGLTDREGRMQWAANAAASSTYAEQNEGEGFEGVDRLSQLEQAVRQMQMDMNELRQRAGLPPRPLLVPQANLDVFLGGLREELAEKRALDRAPLPLNGHLGVYKVRPAPPKEPKILPDAPK